MFLLTHLIDAAKGKHPLAAARSSEWPSVRERHLKLFPRCAVCGGVAKLNVHHIRPFHLHPELELDMRNLITLCEAEKGGVNCHLWFGHLGNFRSFNVDVRKDTSIWSTKFSARPLKDK